VFGFMYLYGMSIWQTSTHPSFFSPPGLYRTNRPTDAGTSLSVLNCRATRSIPQLKDKSNVHPQWNNSHIRQSAVGLVRKRGIKKASNCGYEGKPNKPAKLCAEKMQQFFIAGVLAHVAEETQGSLR
jgi:hypothetical protein